jgi:hypothetical protein
MKFYYNDRWMPRNPDAPFIERFLRPSKLKQVQLVPLASSLFLQNCGTETMTANCLSLESEEIRGVWALMDSHLMMIKCHFS